MCWQARRLPRGGCLRGCAGRPLLRRPASRERRCLSLCVCSGGACHSASAVASTNFHEQNNLHDSPLGAGAQSVKPEGRATERLRWPTAAAPPAAELPCPAAKSLIKRCGPGGARLPRAAGAATGAPAPGRARPARPARRLPGAARLPACGAARAGARALPACAPPAPRRAPLAPAGPPWRALHSCSRSGAPPAARRRRKRTRRRRAAPGGVHTSTRAFGGRAAAELPSPFGVPRRCAASGGSSPELSPGACASRSPQAPAESCGRVRRVHSAAVAALEAAHTLWLAQGPYTRTWLCCRAGREPEAGSRAVASEAGRAGPQPPGNALQSRGGRCGTGLQ